MSHSAPVPTVARVSISRADVMLAVGAAVVVFAFQVLLRYEFIRSYHVTSDEWVYVRHSSAHFPVRPSDWFTVGLSDLSKNFPDLYAPVSGFIRPLPHIYFYVASLFSEGVDSNVYVYFGYVLFAFLIGNVYLLLRNRLLVPRWGAILAIVVYALSPVFDLAFRWPLNFVEALAATFAVLALLAVPVDEGVRFYFPRLIVSALLVCMAVLTKETYVVTAAMAFLILIYADIRYLDLDVRTIYRVVVSKRREFVLYTIPVFLFLFMTVVLSNTFDEAYPIQIFDYGNAIYILIYNIAKTTAVSIFPFHLLPLANALASGNLGYSTLVGLVYLVLNLVTLVAILVSFFLIGPASRAALAYLLLMCFIAVCVQLVLGVVIRHFQFAHIFTLALFIFLATELYRARRSRTIKGAVMLTLALAAVVNPLHYVVDVPSQVSGAAARSEQARAFFAVLKEISAKPDVRRVYLINDQVGRWHSRAMLEVGFWPNDDSARELVVLNQLDGHIQAGSSEAGVSFVAEPNGGLRIVDVVAPWQEILFLGMDFNKLAKSNINQRVRYEVELNPGGGWLTRVGEKFGLKIEQRLHAERRAEFVIPDGTATDFVVVGYDPGEPGPHVYRNDGLGWRRVERTRTVER